MSGTYSRRYDVIVIGAGFSGICAAIKLLEAGIDNLLIVEKADRVGGTWRDNDYPGAACDVMAHLYSLSFAPNPAWNHRFPPQDEILAYLEQVADRHGLTPHIRFGTEIVEQSFDDEQDEWLLVSGSGRQWRARAVIAGTGPLHVPKIPALAGADAFAGAQFHSARWDHGVDLEGKVVAVVGTGASAVQIVPAIVDTAGRVVVFQRTPHWVLPRPALPITRAERALFRLVPGSRVLARGAIYLAQEALIGAFLHPRLMSALRAVARRHLRRQVSEPDLRAALEPDYEIGCKRILISSDYYPALQRPDVSLVTSPITGIEPEGIRTDDGGLHEADAIVYATGFDVLDHVTEQRLRGRAGTPIQQVWRDGAKGYYGVAVHGLPNYFLIMGPNSGVGNQSIVFVIESQVELIVRCLHALFDGEYTRVEVKSHVQAEFNRELQRRSAGTVWTAGGCRSWYLDHAGVNRALWPTSTLSLRLRMRRIALGDFDFSTADDREDGETYTGSATLSTDDGTQITARVRLLARYEPVPDTVKWQGRVEPTPELARLHTQVNQAIRIQVPGRDAVDGVLVDTDPWGGAQLVGWGRSPYRIDVEAAVLGD
ncbi:NAD(P)-binding domain-containing protein [Nocardia sp. NPDC059180]|uniref:NAD(P)-binding domain-containing protein n=1 Tax=Nocardia sp. NPDC059180 TaxID=3346761 RepID=UPI00369E7E28